MEKHPFISKRTLFVFYDLLSSYEVMRTIETLFEAEGILRSGSYQSSLSGQRRSLADEYVSSLDHANRDDARKLLNAMGMFMRRLSEKQGVDTDNEVKQFMQLMAKDGYELQDYEWVPKQSTRLVEMPAVVDQLNLEHIRRDWERAIGQVTDDPEDAITSARAMLESCYKWILDQMGETYSPNDDIGDLQRNVARKLNMAPDQHNEQVFRQILGSLSSLVGGMASLRNRYGDAHGKGKHYYRPLPRHATLTVNMAGTLCQFLIESYLEKQITVETID